MTNAKFLNNIIRRLTRPLGIEISRCQKASIFNYKMVSLTPRTGKKGNVLLAYILEPFLLKPGEAISTKHTHDWESLQIANTFRNLGYAVDVIDFRNFEFNPKKHYSFFVSARSYFTEIGQKLNQDCTKIVHLETSHFLFNNSAAYKRCLELQQRRGIALTSFKWVQPNLAIEHADVATIKGNSFTVSTYSYAKKPYFQTNNPAVVFLPWQESKNFQACRNNFLWLGSTGFVHKGLDLVLEAFTEMPDHYLTVCGPISREKDFAKAFHKELYETANIHTYGWIDVGSREFIDLANRCIGIVYPSCAEGQAGSLINCLQLGLIPIASYQSGVDIGEFGVVLNECTIEEIKASVRRVSAYPEEKLKMMAKSAWKYAEKNHSREKFAEDYEKIIRAIIKNGTSYK